MHHRLGGVPHASASRRPRLAGPYRRCRQTDWYKARNTGLKACDGFERVLRRSSTASVCASIARSARRDRRCLSGASKLVGACVTSAASMPEKDPEYTVVNETRSRTVANRVRKAYTSATRRKGLLGVTHLDEN